MQALRHAIFCPVVVASILTAWLFNTHWCNIRQCFTPSGKHLDQDDGSN